MRNEKTAMLSRKIEEKHNNPNNKCKTVNEIKTKPLIVTIAHDKTTN